VEIVAANADEKTPLPADGRIEMGFNRLLNPFTVTRQSIVLRDKSGQFVNAAVAYDPVQRLVTLSAPGDADPTKPWLLAGVFYEVTLAAEGDAQPFEVRAIDGARPTRTGRRSITFQTTAPTGTPPPSAPPLDYCRDVQSVFTGSCAAGCHMEPPPQGGGRWPYQGLVLTNGDWVAQTAIGRTAHGASTGPGFPTPPGTVFGHDMPIVDPGNPGNSWLLYKMMLGAGTQGDGCDVTPAIVPASAAGRPLDDAERRVLADLVLGEPMGNAAPEVLRRVSAWIAQGARVASCTNACPAKPRDAGADALADAPADASTE
jgi:hypothetical protein